MRPIVVFLFALCVSCASSPGPSETDPAASEAAAGAAELDIEVGDEARVYRSGGGLQVTVVPIESGDPPEALIEVTGGGDDIEGLVLHYERLPQGADRFSYRTTLRGREFHTVWGRQRHALEELDVFIPGSAGRGGHPVSFDEERSEKVDPQAFAERHAAIVSDGTVAELQALDREAREARHDEELPGNLERGLAACETDAPVEIDWSSITDEHILSYSMSSYCGQLRRGLERVCAHRQGREVFQERVEDIRCEFGDEVALDVADGTLTLTVDPEGANLHEVAYDLLRENFGRDRIVVDFDGAYVSLDPGDGDVPLHISENGEAFHEQRETVRAAGGTRRQLFAGAQHSEVLFEDDSWTLTCGDHEVQGQELPMAEARAIMESAEFSDQAWKREPFALARDDRGRYFYVDRMIEDYGGKGFRVFSGPRGSVELTTLSDVVDDSEGTIFATADGELRLILEAGRSSGATWISDGEERELTVLPLHDNAELIYRDLGMYRGKDLGSLCELI